MIKSLMAKFGYNASHRVRQTSLAEVTRTLSEWGIQHQLVGGVSPTDYVTLSRLTIQAIEERKASVPAPAMDDEVELRASLSLFDFAFNVGDSLDPDRSASDSQDLLASIWSSRPVLLFIEGPEEFFSLAGGFAAAIMRRRSRMIRTGGYAPSGPLAPEVLTVERFKSLVGLREPSSLGGEFAYQGAVYLMKDDPNDIQDDEFVALAREVFIPHTYRVKAKFASTSGDTTAGARAMDDEGFPRVLCWVAAFAGARKLSNDIAAQEFVDLASLMAEASQLLDSQMDRATLLTTDLAFRSAFESTEHMVLKNLVARRLRAKYPESVLEIEAKVVAKATIEDSFGDAAEAEDNGVTMRPDVRVPGKLNVEIETLRSLVLPGSNPFFALEQKLRRKLSAYEADRELWILVPNDVALLAAGQMHAVVRNLGFGHPKLRIRLATMDLALGRPIFLRDQEPARAEPRLVGASWREAKKPAVPAKTTWADVAGYSDLKGRLREDVLAPLRDPERYAKYGLASSSGLLLYGLPGCGKSLIGRVLAGEADLVCRRIVPSDVTSHWLGESTVKTREVFDWALKQSSCLLIIDEIDAIAPQRSEGNMHTDEKRAVNELLAQLDRIDGKPVLVVATTNYYRGIDAAVRRTGRFDTKIPIFPPNAGDRKQIFDYYLGPTRLMNFAGIKAVDTEWLAAESSLFAPADIRGVVELVARRAVTRLTGDEPPVMKAVELIDAIRKHTRSIQAADARKWIEEAEGELGKHDPGLTWLSSEVKAAYR